MSQSYTYERYLPYLAEFDLSDHDKRALIDTLWGLLAGILDAEEKGCGQLCENDRAAAHAGSDGLKWKGSKTTTNEFTRAAAIAAPPGKESP